MRTDAVNEEPPVARPGAFLLRRRGRQGTTEVVVGLTADERRSTQMGMEGFERDSVGLAGDTLLRIVI
jgi:hypothetical protein